MKFPTKRQPDVGADEVRPLIEESRDLHTDSMAATKESLAELVELGRERRVSEGIDPEEAHLFAERRDRLSNGAFSGRMLAAAGAGAAFAVLLASEAFASSPSDVQILQTQASIENLAVATYQTA